MSCKSHLLAAAARWLSHEHFHPSVPKLLCFQFALDNFVAGGPCSWPTPASPCIEDRLHHRIPFWCCPNLNPMRTSTATPSHGKVILYLSLKDWDSFSSQAFKCWLYQLKKKKVWSWKQCKAGQQVTEQSQNSPTRLYWSKDCCSICGRTPKLAWGESLSIPPARGGALSPLPGTSISPKCRTPNIIYGQRDKPLPAEI